MNSLVYQANVTGASFVESLCNSQTSNLTKIGFFLVSIFGYLSPRLLLTQRYVDTRDKLKLYIG